MKNLLIYLQLVGAVFLMVMVNLLIGIFIWPLLLLIPVIGIGGLLGVTILYILVLCKFPPAGALFDHIRRKEELRKAKKQAEYAKYDIK